MTAATKRVTPSDFRTAAEWLDVNEGEDGEAEACRRVAEWLLVEASKREERSDLRALAKEHGMSVPDVRVALARAKAKATAA